MEMTRPSVPITPAEHPAMWRGCVDWTVENGAWQPWRLPADRVGTAHAPELTLRARMAAGVRAGVRTDAERVTVSLRCESADEPQLDVVVNQKLWARMAVGPGETSSTVELPPGVNTVEVWLPQFGELALRSLELGAADLVEPAPDDQPRWVTYGSSITQCRHAAGPSETWPAIVARTYDWDLTCLGFGGQCHLDPVAMRTIAGLPADLISLCLGINVYGAASFSARSWASQVSGFVESIRDAHPTTPIVVISPIACPDREATPNGAGLTLGDIRQSVADAVGLLQHLGDDRLTLIDGRSIMSDDDAHLLEDGLHPGAAGYRTMADRLGPQLGRVLARD